MNKEFRRKLSEDLAGLLYLSETDAHLEVVPFEEARELSFNEFFAPLIKKETWMSDEERTTADKFRKLKSFIQANMKRKRVYKIGAVEIDVLIVGEDLSGAPIVLRTKAVET